MPDPLVDQLLEAFSKLSASQQHELASHLFQTYPVVFNSADLELTKSRDEHDDYNTKMNMIEVLDQDSAAVVFSYLDGFRLLSCRLVSKQWKETLESISINEVWQREFTRIFRSSRSSFSRPGSFKPPLEENWFEVWRRHLKNRQTWLKLSNKEESVINKWEFLGHSDRVRHVRIRGNKFVSASWDGSIRLGDTQRLAEQTVPIVQHKGSVFGVWFDGRIVASCSEDNTVCIYDIVEDKLLTVLKGHNGPVYRIEILQLGNDSFHEGMNTVQNSLSQYDNTLLVSCSSDFIGVWDWKAGVLLKKLTGHKHDVHRLQISGHLIITGSYDQTVKIWQMNVKNASLADAIQTYSSPPYHRGGVSALHVADNLVGSGSAHGDIFIYDIATSQLVFRANNNRGVESRDTSKNIVTCVYIDKSLDLFICCSILSFYSGAGHVCFWNIGSGKCMKTIKQSSYINSLKYEYGLLFSAESDGCIRIRDLVGKNHQMRAELVHEERMSKGQLFDVDVQGEAMVACGLDRVFLLRPFCK